MRLSPIVLVLAAGLAACEDYETVALTSHEPLFTFQDPTAMLKPGVWVTDQDGCDIDGRRPVSEWPECAAVAVVGEGFIGDWPTRFPYVITPNSVRVLQIGYSPERYGYEMVTALGYDPEGRVTAMRRESLSCTADAAPADPGEDPVSPAPPAQGPSLACPVTDPDQVLNLAEASSPFAGVEPNFRWMRDKLD